MIDASRVCLFVPDGLRGFKQNLFDRIASKLNKVIRGSFNELTALPDSYIPVIGCTPELKPIIASWKARGRQFCYWDRGYARRVFATWLKRGVEGGYYRWHMNNFQMPMIDNVPSDRWDALDQELTPWVQHGRHIVVAMPTPTYARFHGIEGWLDRTMEALSLLTDRQIVVRGKESKRSLAADLKDAHALVAHGSNAAVEAAIMGCPVFVDKVSAAALLGNIDLNHIEKPVYMDRTRWAHSLAYCQFNEKELVDGTLWKLLK